MLVIGPPEEDRRAAARMKLAEVVSNNLRVQGPQERRSPPGGASRAALSAVSRRAGRRPVQGGADARRSKSINHSARACRGFWRTERHQPLCYAPGPIEPTILVTLPPREADIGERVALAPRSFGARPAALAGDPPPGVVRVALDAGLREITFRPRGISWPSSPSLRSPRASGGVAGRRGPLHRRPLVRGA